MEQGKPEETVPIRVFTYRWIILAIFCLYSAINFVQFLQYSIISNIIAKYYDVDGFAVDILGLIFMISYIVACIPLSNVIERYNLKVTAILGSGLTAVGNLLKLVSVERDRYPVVVVAQLLCGVAQVFILSIPAKLASTWFGPEEVSTACAIAVFGTQFGIAVGCVMSPNMVKNRTVDNIGADLFTMMIYNAVITCVIFLVVVIFFKAKPILPPSQSQAECANSEPPQMWPILKKMFTNKNYLILIGSFGMANGIWSTFGIVFNSIYLEYFPGSETDVGWISALAVLIGGCIGSVVFGYLLDRTHRFRLISFVSIFFAATALIVVLYTLEASAKLATYFSIPVFGFFLASTLVISFEYATEITYPLPETIACSVLNAVIFLFTIIFTLVFEELFADIGYMWTSIVIIILLYIASVTVCFVSPELNRRNANIHNENETVTT